MHGIIIDLIIAIYITKRTKKLNHDPSYFQLTSSNARSSLDPSNQVNLGDGYPPTAWQVTSTSLSADTWLILPNIETAVGFTKIK